MWEEEVLLSLKEDLEGVILTNQVDKWRWKFDDFGVFTVNSYYKRLEGLLFNDLRWRDEEKGVFALLWKCPAPSKVVALAWRVLLNRIPTKENLSLRNVLGPGVHLGCGMCNRIGESALHLFLHCKVANAVWLKLMRWLDCLFITPPNLFVHWECWHGWERDKKVKKRKGVVWLATIWVLWNSRNDKVFNDAMVEVDVIVDEVIVLAWKWAMCKMCMPVCQFFEWRWNPLWCLRRSQPRLS
jgi:hypothetical protein